jgi:hypothetical protein
MRQSVQGPCPAHLFILHHHHHQYRKGFIPYLRFIATEPTALLQPIQNLERSIFRDCAPLENSAGKLSESYAEISCCESEVQLSHFESTHENSMSRIEFGID